MNERIKELWSQAGGHYDSGNQHTWPQYTIDDPEKFALLLMREIAMFQIAHQARMDVENKKMDDPAKELNYAVIEHFGVGK
jgi:hypothetical protein